MRTERDGGQQVPAPAAATPASPAVAAHVGEPAPLGTGSVLALQRSAGNAAVSGLMPQAASDDVIARTAADPADSEVERALAVSARDRGGARPAESPAFRSPALQLRALLRTRVLQRADDDVRRRLVRPTTTTW